MDKIRIRANTDPTYCVTCATQLPNRTAALRHRMFDHIVTSTDRGERLCDMLVNMRDAPSRHVRPRGGLINE